MRSARATSIVLWAMAAYTGLLGLLFTAFQGLAAAAFRTPVRDPQSLFGFGVALLTIAALKVVMAREPSRYRTMVGIILASEVIFALWQLYTWLVGGWTGVAVTGLIDAAFAVLLAVYFPRPYLFRVAEAG